MTFALTKFRASGIPLEGATKKRGLQRMVFEFTAAASNHLVSLGDFSSTFWTDVDASDMGLAVLALVRDRIQPQVATLLSVRSPQLADRVSVATAGAGVVTKLDSAASAGGDNTETYTVTGLLTTDVVLGVTIFEKGAGTAANLPIIDFGSATGTVAVAAALPVEHVGDPGAGCKVRVAVLRPATGEYSMSIQNDLPNIATAASDGETSWVIETIHELDDGVEPVFAEFG